MSILRLVRGTTEDAEIYASVRPIAPALVSCQNCGDYYSSPIEPCVHGRQLCGGCAEFACVECREGEPA